MKRLFYLFFVVLLLPLMYACGDDNQPIPEPTPEPQPLPALEHCVIIYMVAENNLNDYVQNDIREIEKGQKNIPAGSGVVVFLDPSSGNPTITRYDADRKTELYKYSENISCLDSTTMDGVLRRIMDVCPSRDYSLVFWSHGMGWTPAKGSMRTRYFGQDGSKYMNIPVLRGVLEQFSPFKYILFDACFMQCIEVAYELKDVTPWLIGSPAEIPGDGAPYHAILKSLCEADVENIARNYHDYYTDPNGAPLSVIRTGDLDSLAAATARVLPSYFTERTTPSTRDIQTYKGMMGETEFFDMKSAVYHIAGEEAYLSWLPYFERAVPFQLPVESWTTYRTGHTAYLNDMEHYGGVSIFLPSTDYDFGGVSYATFNGYFHHYRWYQAAGWDATGW